MRRYRYPAPLAVALILAGTSAAAWADEAPKSATTKFDELLDSAGLTVSGYVAASYYASNGYPSNIHQFDTRHNTFQLDEAGFQVAYQPKEGFGALVDVIAGEDAKILHQAESGNSQADSQFDLRQGILEQAVLAIADPRARKLVLVEKSELHGVVLPIARYSRHRRPSLRRS